MITRLCTWWDRHSPWRAVERAEARAKATAVQLLEVESEFTAYITWATQRIDRLERFQSRGLDREITLTRANLGLRADNATLTRLTTAVRDQRESARSVAVRLEQENAHLLAVVRSANTELCKAVMWAPAERMPELAAVLDVVDEALAGVCG